MSAFRSVVLLALPGIGNAVLAIPLVRQLARAAPDARLVAVAGNRAMADVFRRMPEVDDVAVLGRTFAARLRTLVHLRRERFDVCLVPFPSNRWEYNLFAFLCGSRRRVLHRFPLGRWSALGVLPAERVDAEPGLHDVDQNLRLLGPLGIDSTPGEAPRFDLDDDEIAAAAAMLAAAGLEPEHRPLAFHAGASRTAIGAAKRWPPERYAELLSLLSEKAIVIEGPDEVGVGDEIVAAATARGLDPPPVVRLAGPLGVSAAVLARCRLYVGSDSGLAHLAAAVGTRAVTFFAASDPDRVCPFGQRALVVQTPDCERAPCNAYPWRSTRPRIECRPPYCIGAIEAAAVHARVAEALGRSPGQGS